MRLASVSRRPLAAAARTCTLCALSTAFAFGQLSSISLTTIALVGTGSVPTLGAETPSYSSKMMIALLRLRCQSSAGGLGLFPAPGLLVGFPQSS